MNTILKGKINCLKMYYKSIELLKASKHIFFSIVLIIYARPSYSQEQRLNDDNSTGWFAYTDGLTVSRFGNAESLSGLRT